MTDLISRLTHALQAPDGDRIAAIDALWTTLSDDDHAGRCIVAHYAADQQPTLADEVRWDEISLAESTLITDDDLASVQPGLTVGGLRPSLHLNLADGYRRQERFAAAIAQLDRGRPWLSLFDDAPAEQAAYTETIIAGYDRADRLIAARSTAPSRPATDG